MGKLRWYVCIDSDNNERSRELQYLTEDGEWKRLPTVVESEHRKTAIETTTRTYE